MEHRGVFIERSFAFELDPREVHWRGGRHEITERDFILSDYGEIRPIIAVIGRPRVFVPIPVVVPGGGFRGPVSSPRLAQAPPRPAMPLAQAPAAKPKPPVPAAPPKPAPRPNPNAATTKVPPAH
jgi:hypothetical protein